jgi:hypothetical protein
LFFHLPPTPSGVSFFFDPVKIKKGFGIGIAVTEPLCHRVVVVALDRGLEEFCKPPLRLGQNVSHLFVHWVLLKLLFSQLDFFNMCFDLCPFESIPLLC